MGRPRGTLSNHTKLTGEDETIKELLQKRVSGTTAAGILDVSRLTADSYMNPESPAKSRV